jgi:hypothetical protein
VRCVVCLELAFWSASHCAFAGFLQIANCARCALHRYLGTMPGMRKGDLLGHEVICVLPLSKLPFMCNVSRQLSTQQTAAGVKCGAMYWP